ncbi:hypothetical protein [Pengzhenrongella sicca]|uniref:hypothetical protein n=1 Tax=Pengzhenrongella sicca TaxID=2819238 RepID=UPI001D0C599E|nr:hypothetical protein [Pengzhenrongella sicca]
MPASTAMTVVVAAPVVTESTAACRVVKSPDPSAATVRSMWTAGVSVTAAEAADSCPGASTAVTTNVYAVALVSPACAKPCFVSGDAVTRCAVSSGTVVPAGPAAR